MSNEDLKNKSVLFFDGECNLCNSAVDFLIERDHKRKLFFSSLQGETSKILLNPSEYKNLDSAVFFQNQRTHKKSSAVLRAFISLGGLYKFALLFLAVPAFLRDPIYIFAANRRYKWFGKRDSCRVPSKKELQYFLP